MKKNIIFLAFLALNSLYSYAQVFVYIDKVPNDTQDTDTLYFASNINNWNPKDKNYAFIRDVSGRYNLELRNVDAPIEYKITRGSWRNVETDTRGMAIENRKIYSFTDNNSSIEVLGWFDHLFREENTVSKNVKIMSEFFHIPQLDRDRRIWIYLPESYGDTTKRYPVLYMHDGQNLFNNATSFSGEWCVDESMDRIIKNGGKESIIIGIDNGGEYRIEELTPFKNDDYGGGDGSKYIDFIVATLKPYIDTHYRTLKDRDNTAIAGSSLGGLISFYAIIKYKNVFSKAGVMSPSLWFSNRIYYIPEYRDTPMKIYFSAGDEESEDMVSDIEKMTTKMKKFGYPDSSIKVHIIKGAEHNEKQWSEEFPEMYNWLMN